MGMSRADRMDSYKLVDCTIFNAQAKLGLDVNHIDFTTELFAARIHTRVNGTKPYDETLRLIQAFIEKASTLPPDSKEVVFVHYTLMPDARQANKLVRTAWKCKVVAYVDAPTGRKCLEFSEEL